MNFHSSAPLPGQVRLSNAKGRPPPPIPWSTRPQLHPGHPAYHPSPSHDLNHTGGHTVRPISGNRQVLRATHNWVPDLHEWRSTHLLGDVDPLSPLTPHPMGPAAIAYWHMVRYYQPTWQSAGAAAWECLGQLGVAVTLEEQPGYYVHILRVLGKTRWRSASQELRARLSSPTVYARFGASPSLRPGNG
ncbi:hypothetical protein BT96DRAFT_1000349 [Gymnopus androsaceus JB14]|uniref:Uncharacterized protein n=1 Tax=Gymnopus androsaceus JB14 TaxID=1447944 RepID=A0A6A4H5E5_9AGAR|nr:hypothetical protein BT96DRAFT_1000349 [Gymnopus androsaceus JB14]